MIIRPYRETDRQQVQEITANCFQDVSIDHGIERMFGEIGGKDWRWRKARHIDADIAAHPKGILIAELDGRVVGYITTRVDHEAKIGSIPNLAVLPEAQGQGLGRRLIQTALDALTEQGMLYARIETLAQNAVGQHLYPSFGFQEITRQIHYIMPLSKEDAAENVQ